MSFACISNSDYSEIMQLNAIKRMERLARGDPSIVSLGQGIPFGRSDEHIRNAVRMALRDNPAIDRYSDPLGLTKLRQKIASQLEEQNIIYDTDEIMVTCGAIEAINTTLLALVTSQKDEVIVPTPTYSAYSRAVTLARGKLVPVQLNGATDWQLELAQVATSITSRTAALLICNPNNPTGSLYNKRTLLALCEMAKQRDFKIIIDEVYGNMCYDTKFFTPAVEPTYRSQIVRVVSFSKDFNLTGWRIGYLHTDKSLIKQLVPVHDTLVNCSPLPSQCAALAALEIAPRILAANRRVYRHHRRVMAKHLDAMSEWFDYSLPDGGYFFFPRLKITTNAKVFCNELARQAQVVVVPGEDFGPGGARHIRLCFGRSLADINEGMRRIENYMQTTYARPNKKVYSKVLDER